jgi:hypothetical protein
MAHKPVTDSNKSGENQKGMIKAKKLLLRPFAPDDTAGVPAYAQVCGLRSVCDENGRDGALIRTVRFIPPA